MKKGKGFTLVELLAVIVILAVLVLLAVPSVIKMLDNTKKNAFAVEAENIIKAGKNAYASEMLDGTFENGCYSLKKLEQYTDKNFDGYSGSVYIDSEANTFKVWLSKDDYIVNGSTSGNIKVEELSQVQPASTTCEDIEIIACSDTPLTYTLAIDPNGGIHDGKSTVETYEIERNGVKGINDPYKIGYAFDGWETIAGSVTSFTSRLLTMANTNVEIRAKWKVLYTYTGSSALIDDGDGNWRIRLLTDGTLIFNEDPGPIDIFLVGGGGSGNGGGGGGGGYTRTVPSYVVTKNREYEIDIGDGGFGGSGGVGGNAGLPTIAFGLTVDGGAGASPNADGDVAGGGGSHVAGGAGGGGNGGLYVAISGAGQPNTGGGGGGNSATSDITQRTYGSGGSGIVIIRNHRSSE